MNKNKIVFLYITCICIAITSCLKVNPKDAFPADGFYKTPADYRSAYIAIYATLLQDGTYSRNLWSNFDFGNDELNQNRISSPNDMIHYNYDATTSALNDTWTQLYNGIGRANSFLANLQNLSDSLSYYAAEVRFLRGYFYFLLAQHWGNVPVRDKPFSSLAATTDINFQPVDSVYLFAIKDMEMAYPQLQTIQQTNAGRVSKTTCAGILARVYLYAASYCYDADKPALYKQVKGKNFEAQLKNTSAAVFLKKVQDWTDTVMNNGYYNAAGITGISYDSIFVLQTQDQYYTKESMWEVEFLGNRAGSFSDYFTAGRVGVQNGISGPPGAAYGYISPYLVRNYDTTNDKRYKRNAPYITYKLGAGGVIDSIGNITSRATTCGLGKWRRTDEKVLPLNTNYTPTNFPLLRYADVVLMAAEATNELMLLYGGTPSLNAQNIIDNMKAIKQRAGIPQDIPAFATYALRDTIRIERLRELVGEALRRQDLIRWGTYLSQINITLQLYNSNMLEVRYSPITLENIINGGIKFIIQPIPQQEINLNKAPTARQHPLWQ